MIGQETIDQVRERTDLVALIGENVRLKKQGRRWVGLCPFHKERTPSFSVNRERGLFHCFGCKESGGAIDYVMKVEGLRFPEAVQVLADKLGIEVETSMSPEEQQRQRQRRAERDVLLEVNQQLAVFFEQQLRGGHPLAPYAWAEIQRRGLDPGDAQVDETLRAFKLGYAPYGWGGLADYLERQGISLEDAEKVGAVMRRRSGRGYYDAFRHRLMFAILDKAGRVVGFSGRALAEPSEADLAQAGIASTLRPGAEQREPPKYVNSPESPVYVKGDTVFGLYQGRSGIRDAGTAVLVEGNFDVVSLHARGFDLAVAPLGTALTDQQARLIKRYAPRVVVMFDGDKAGRKATAACRGPAREAGLAADVASLPDGADADDYARAKGAEGIRAVVDNAQGLLEWMIDTILKGVSGASLRGRQARLRRVAELLGEENDPALRAMAKAYADQLASKLVVDGRSPTDIRALEQMIHRSLNRSASPETGRVVPSSAQARSQARPERIAELIVGALLDFPELLDDAEVGEALSTVEGEAALAVAAMREIWDEKKSLNGPEILDLFPEAIHHFAVGRLASPRFVVKEEAHAEITKNAVRLRRHRMSQETASAADQFSRVRGDSDAEDEILRRLVQQKRRLI
ncbi:MAG: CHC2 zinc finger domain-containing protein [Myxococcota bacterium]